MRCKAGRTGGPAAEHFELSGFYHLRQGAGGEEDEEEDGLWVGEQQGCLCRSSAWVTSP